MPRVYERPEPSFPSVIEFVAPGVDLDRDVDAFDDGAGEWSLAALACVRRHAETGDPALEFALAEATAAAPGRVDHSHQLPPRAGQQLRLLKRELSRSIDQLGVPGGAVALRAVTAREPFEPCALGRFFERWTPSLWRVVVDRAWRARASRSAAGKRVHRARSDDPAEPQESPDERAPDPSAELAIDEVLCDLDAIAAPSEEAVAGIDERLAVLLQHAVDHVLRRSPSALLGGRRFNGVDQQTLRRRDEPASRGRQLRRIFVTGRAVAVALSAGTISIRTDKRAHPGVAPGSWARSLVTAMSSLSIEALRLSEPETGNASIHQESRRAVGHLLYLLEQACRADGLDELADGFGRMLDGHATDPPEVDDDE